MNALTPDNGGIGGGTVVTITGTNLGGATGVTFDGIAGTDLVVSSDTSLRNDSGDQFHREQRHPNHRDQPRWYRCEGRHRRR
ncbi:IPT/TIG domain-containing protein [Lacisediminihabitans sp. G11-30]|uniref:IPT/TIG domain-containing protein n=1 Tax=Lacisediminihabitans changchengi TaxID=2787634 RepID=A0A934SL77_9MICO|nr:IPT/TIG domain-containing protein [Lacisediminihabitans changchengi]